MPNTTVPYCRVIFPHFGAIIHHDVVYDRMGIGALKHAYNEAALWTMMRPSIFLGLATHLSVPRPSLVWLKEKITEGEAIAPAELRIALGRSHPIVVSHEGRHRMNALKVLLDDAEVPVRISFKHCTEHDLRDEIISRVRNRMLSQRGTSVVDGPFFGEVELDEGSRFQGGIPPPLLYHYLGRTIYEPFTG